MIRRCAALLLCLTGCDTFFEVHGTVTRCDTGQPLVGVQVAAELESGVSDDEEATDSSDPDGRYSVTLNEPPSASATIVWSKPTFQMLRKSFDESPDEAQDVCLVPVSP